MNRRDIDLPVAEAIVERFEANEAILLEAAIAVEAAREIDMRQADVMGRRVLKIARSNAIKTLLSYGIHNSLQYSLTKRSLEIFDAVDATEQDTKENKLEEKVIPDMHEGVSAMPQLAYAMYSLTIEKKEPRPLDGDLALVGRPTLTLSDRFEGETRATSLVFSQGTFSHDTFEGVVLASTVNEGKGDFVPALQMPQLVTPHLLADLETLQAISEANISDIPYRALGVFALRG